VAHEGLIAWNCGLDVYRRLHNLSIHLEKRWCRGISGGALPGTAQRAPQPRRSPGTPLLPRAPPPPRVARCGGTVALDLVKRSPTSPARIYSQPSHPNSSMVGSLGRGDLGVSGKTPRKIPRRRGTPPRQHPSVAAADRRLLRIHIGPRAAGNAQCESRLPDVDVRGVRIRTAAPSGAVDVRATRL
jgi:hypothetical protein